MSLIPLNQESRSEKFQSLKSQMSSKIVGQQSALDPILDRYSLWEAGMSDPSRPIGNFLLLGPTGTGKTRTVEALAEALHGSSRNVLKIDCGEFQMEHEVAKLIGAPPGYLGHRETGAVLSQKRITEAASEKIPISLVLFDEIEKAAPSLQRFLLGVLDKAHLTLGDNSNVSFSNCMIFLTTNLGSREMLKYLNPSFGFESAASGPNPIKSKIESIGLGAVTKHFSPEFVNRIDKVLTYEPLTPSHFAQILDLELTDLTRRFMNSGRVAQVFELNISPSVKDLLLSLGVSMEYGARHLKRTIDRFITVPIANLVNSGQVKSGDLITADLDGEVKFFKTGEMAIVPAQDLSIPTLQKYTKKGK